MVLGAHVNLRKRVKMGRLSIEDRLRVITLHSNNFSFSTILKRLQGEKILVSLRALYNLVKKHGETGIIVGFPRQQKQRKFTEEMMEFTEQEMMK